MRPTWNHVFFHCYCCSVCGVPVKDLASVEDEVPCRGLAQACRVPEAPAVHQGFADSGIRTRIEAPAILPGGLQVDVNPVAVLAAVLPTVVSARPLPVAFRLCFDSPSTVTCAIPPTAKSGYNRRSSIDFAGGVA